MLKAVMKSKRRRKIEFAENVHPERSIDDSGKREYYIRAGDKKCGYTTQSFKLSDHPIIHKHNSTISVFSRFVVLYFLEKGNNLCYFLYPSL